jgi:hypothetical protein
VGFSKTAYEYFPTGQESKTSALRRLLSIFLSTAVKIHQYSDCIVLINTFLPDFLKTFKICKV